MNYGDLYMKNMLMILGLATAARALELPKRRIQDSGAKEPLGGEQLYLLTDLMLTDASMVQDGSCEGENSLFWGITFCYKASEHDNEVKCEAWPPAGSDLAKNSSAQNVACEARHSLGPEPSLDSKGEEMRGNEWEPTGSDLKVDSNGQEMMTNHATSTENEEHEVYDKKEFSCFLGFLLFGDSTLYLASDGRIRVFLGLNQNQLGSDLTKNQFKAKELTPSQLYSLKTEKDVYTSNNLAILKNDYDDIPSIEREVCEFFYPRSKKTTKQPRGQPRLLSTCDAGYYSNGSTCEACTSPCTECADSGADQCTMCAGNTPPSASPGWCECISGTYETASNPLMCAYCHSSCSECNGTAETDCTACSSGNDPSTTEGRCACPSTEYATTENPLVCADCDIFCLDCSGPSATDCTTCSSGNDPSTTEGKCACGSGAYQTSSNPLVCVDCDPSCAECLGSTATDCIVCSSGNSPFSTGGRCACTSSQYTTTENPLVCGDCDSSCSECSGPDATDCTACSSGNDPSTTGGRCACPSTEYATTENPLVCADCDFSCSECSGPGATDCTACSSGNNPSTTEGRCSCGSGTYQTASNPLTCVDCDPSCLECLGSTDSNCLTCSSGNNPLTTGGRCACGSGTYQTAINPLVCVDCDPSCSECSGTADTECTACSSGNNPSTTEGRCACPSSEYATTENPLVCADCDPSCSECSGPDATDCTACSSGNDPSTTEGRCTCPSTEYATTENPLVCADCDFSCSECSGPGTTACTTCSSGNDPSTTGGRCACGSGTYQTSSNPLVCVDCDSSCLECLGSADTNCLTCSSGNNPLTTQGRCACPSSQYATTENPLVCADCDPSCSECSGPDATDCTACSSGNDPSTTGGRCACPSSEYATTENPLVCADCDFSCSECSGPGATDCTACSSGNDPSTTEGRCACGSGTYQTASNPLVCVDCDPSCLECLGSTDTNCLTCSSGNNPLTTQGRCACPSSEYATTENPLVCAGCDPSCSECTGPSDSECSACPNPKLLNGTICIDTCPDGKYLDGSSCVSSCPDGKYLDGLTCVSSCPVGKYPSGASCVDCPTQCTACSASITCTACADKYYLTDTGSCLSCSDSLCNTCTDSSCSACVTNASPVEGTCQCDSGYYQSSGACVELCDLCVSCDASSECTCVDYATFVAGAASTDLCQCSQSTQIGTFCVPTGDYYNNNDNIDRIEFNAEFLELAVHFKSSPAYVDISDASDCSNYVLRDTLALLGTSPSCARAQSGTSITVTLGSGYTLRKGNSVFLNWLHIRESTSSLSTDYVSLSATATGGDYPTPDVVITGPASLYLACGQTSVAYSTSVQTGAANNALTHRWSISPDLPTPLANSELDQSSLTIPNSAFGSVSVDYSISVTATNVFDVSATASVNLSVSADSGISVSFAGGSSIQITSDDTRQIESIAEERCGETGSVSYRWSFESTASGSIPSGTTLISDRASKRLIIQAGSHAPGETYNYRCTATSGSISGFSIFSFEVLYSQPVALMNIEDGTVSNANTLVLDSGGSNDPSNREISLLWSCVDQDSNTCQSSSGAALISSANQSNASLSIPGTDLIIGKTLSITLTVTTSDNRSAVQTKTIEVVDGGNISIQTVAITKKILVHRQLIVKLAVSNGASIRWSQISSPSISISSSLTVPYLWIQPSTMSEGETYTFQATVTDSNGKSIYVRISWTTNKPPSCGGEELQMLSDHGFLATIGINDCFDQDETDLPLSYSFGAVWNGFVLPCVYRTLSNSLTIWTFPGIKQFVVFVCDKLGSCIAKESTITITRNRMLTNETAIQTDFYDAKNQNSDLVPLVILEMSNAYTLTETDWEFLFSELESYTNSMLLETEIFDQTTVTTFMGTIAGLLTEYSAMSTSHAVQGVDYILSLIQNAEEKLDSTDLELISDAILSLTTNYASDNQIFSKVLALQAEVNNAQLKEGPSGENPLEFKSSTSGFASITQRITGEDISSLYTLSTTVGANTYSVSARNISEIASSDLIDVEVIVVPSVSASDSVSVNFYKAGTYDSSTVSLAISETRTVLSIANQTDLINITVPYSYNSNLTYGVYVLENNEWTFDANIVLINQTDGFMIQTPHLSSFRIQEHVFEITAASEGDCDFYFLPVALMLLAILISAILIPSAWQLEKRPKGEITSGIDLDETKNLSRRAKTRNSAAGMDSDNYIHNFTYYHAVFGQLHEGSVPMIDRASEIGISILRNLLFVGLFLYSQENVDEHKEEVDAEEYLAYGFYSSLISFILIILSELMLYPNSNHPKMKRTIRWVVVGILTVVSIVGISFFSSIFCDTWSKIWCLVLFFALALEWIVYYSIYALIRLCISSRRRGPVVDNYFK